ncbi:MAG: SLBB domain-containing protein [Gemmatimonadales bacterium]
MKILTHALCGLAAAMTFSTANAQTPVPPPPTPATVGVLGAGQYLNPGDQVRIIVWRKPEFSGDFPVAANGTLIHPLYREVPVTGVPMSVVEDRLRTFLTRFETNPQFVIQPLVKIIIGGEVRSPNIYSVPPELTIAQAIAFAGGATERGNFSDVKVIRDRQTIKMDISRPDSEAGLLQIRSNDQILVGRKRQSAWQYIAPLTGTISVAIGLINLLTR